MHSTNYVDTFIQVAEDSTVSSAAVPPKRTTPGIAELTFRMIAEAPYRYTSDDVIFTVWADRRGIPEAERAAARDEFFAKGQPCLRASDLGKRYGWGIHADSAGRVALVPLGSTEYAQLTGGRAPDGRTVTVTRAMRSSRRSGR
ncbi:DUF6157 family protein [Micromonospora sp. NPDC049301]|uniref:DUF6157 family protein n=1 Tax=Micromonospora sp. NPDC049301 TaxID=3155723 RepID=UPI00342A0AA6